MKYFPPHGRIGVVYPAVITVAGALSGGMGAKIALELYVAKTVCDTRLKYHAVATLTDTNIRYLL
jgi:shikimate kinase